jgi:hypothetical protein
MVLDAYFVDDGVPEVVSPLGVFTSEVVALLNVVSRRPP